ncbi:hypothetical protein EVAR_62326_1 [Eumeta japonica]|uniref:Uncharacterized protein n=1 Tax=Eumeta variegata TaxID=151549 RepID=A0A4C1Z345_EUMVA|nr:hypothetical protein EVAR_62326_1 [Eumeta japonica]
MCFGAGGAGGPGSACDEWSPQRIGVEWPRRTRSPPPSCATAHISTNKALQYKIQNAEQYIYQRQLRPLPSLSRSLAPASADRRSRAASSSAR